MIKRLVTLRHNDHKDLCHTKGRQVLISSHQDYGSLVSHFYTVILATKWHINVILNSRKIFTNVIP